VFRRVPVVALVLAAFAGTTAVPSSGVVEHHHAGGDHDHVHAFFVADHHDQGHDRHDRRKAEHARRHRGHAHRPGVRRGAHDPLSHTHVFSPFQPATSAHSPGVAFAIPRAAPGPSTPRYTFRARPTVRSRGPPRPGRS